jgi:hypothetical protein
LNLAKLIGWISLQNYAYESWLRFRSELAGVVLASVTLGVVAIVALYHRSAHALRISRPADPFRPFTPLRWLWLALAPALAAATYQFFLYQKILGPHVPFDELWWTFLVVAGATWFVSELVVSRFPRITPAKFRYHPRLVKRWLWSRRGA